MADERATFAAMCLRTLACRLCPFALSFVALATLANCGSSTAAPLGTEGAACFAPETAADVDGGRDGGTLRCNEGLTCQANVCMKPAGGGEIVDTASEPLGDAGVGDAAEAAIEGGAPDADGGAQADGGAAETSADAPVTGADGDASDASVSDGTADDGVLDVPPAIDAGDASDAVLDLGPG
jgi:hypothetical protein